MSTQYLPLTSGPIDGGKGTWIEASLYTGIAVYGGFSGRFYTITGGYATICTDSTQTIACWIQSGSITSASNTASGMFKRPALFYDAESIFRIPCYGAAFAQSYVGSCCDLIVSSSIQYAYLTQSTHDLLIIVGGYAGDAAADSYVDVVMNSAEFYKST